MNIQPTQNYSTQFKAGYPVVHWVRETNGSYAPAVSQALNTQLQKGLVRLLNGNINKVSSEKLNITKYIKAVLSRTDKDFSEIPKARSFYNSKGGWINGNFEPLAYLLTGKHAIEMTENFGKSIGRAKAEAPRFGDSSRNTAEVNIALYDYFYRGLSMVKNLSSRFKGSKQTHYALHTKYEVIRTKTGKIKEYRLEDVRFCPMEGPNNPFVRTGYIKA